MPDAYPPRVNVGTMTQEEIDKHDFAWAVFIEPVYRFMHDVHTARLADRQPKFQLVDHQQGRLTVGGLT